MTNWVTARLNAGMDALPALKGHRPSPFVIVTFGASTTAPREDTYIFTDRLRDTLGAEMEALTVINAGVRGNTTEAARERLQSEVLDHQPDLVIICLGINDSTCDVWKDPPQRTPRVPLETYLRNMEYFCDRIRASGAACLLLTTQPLSWTPALKGMYGKPPYAADDPDGFNATLRTYMEALRAFARDRDLPLVDLYSMFQDCRIDRGVDLCQWFPDGMHPNSEGHALIADYLIPEVRRIRAIGPAG